MSALALGGAGITSLGDHTFAQITPDSTLGANEQSLVRTNVEINGLPADQIGGGAVRGANLFHSFREFNVGEGRGAYFINPAGVENILSRVTGNNPSNILGTLGVLGDANLFLLNPNGIVFGPSASLDVGGSFVATTANAIQFGDQGFFSASAPNTPSLLAVNPSAFLFNQIAAQPVNSIANQGSLSVPNAQSLLLLGGNPSPNASSTGGVLIDGGELLAPGGRVELGGAAGAGTVGLSGSGNSLSLSFPAELVRADVSLTNGALVDVAAGGGSIVVNAQNLDILGGTGLLAGIRPGSGSSEDVRQSNAGSVTINAQDAVTIAGVNADGLGSAIFSDVETGAMGNAGGISITANTLSLAEGATLSSSTLGQGNAGDISVQADGDVSLTNSGIFSTVGAGAVGDGGLIDINAGSLSLTEGAQLLTSVGQAFGTLPGGKGNAGSVAINSQDAVTIAGANANGLGSAIFSDVETGAMGNAGDISITANTLSLAEGATLSSSTFGQGNVGDISVQAEGNVSLANGNIFSTVESGAVGDGGIININAGSLSLTEGTQLLTSVRGASEDGILPGGKGNAGSVTINAQDAVTIAGANANGFSSGVRSTLGTGAMGNAGGISITTNTLSLADGATLSSSTLGQGNAGSIFLQTEGDVSLTNGNIFSTVESGAVGDGGLININAGSLSLTEGAQLLTSVGQASGTLPSGKGNAGSVTVNARDAVTIAGANANGVASAIFSDVEAGAMGNAGGISITANTLFLAEGTALSSSTFGKGNAGSIFVQADGDVSLANSNTFSTVESGAEGDGGVININAGSLSLTEGAQLLTSVRGASEDGTLPGGKGNAGSVTINAQDNASFDGVGGNGAPSGAFSTVEAGVEGNAGNVNVTTGSLSLTDGASLSSSTFGTGDAGSVTIDARGNISLDGVGSAVASRVESGAMGNGGSIDITTGSLSVTNGAVVSASTFGRGNAGSVTINARDSISFDGVGSNRLPSAAASRVEEVAVGNGGSIDITAGSLAVTNGAVISARTIGQGDAGRITINTRDSVALDGVNPSRSTTFGTAFGSGIFSTVEEVAVGNGGSIDITTGSLAVTNGALVSTASTGQGDAGNVKANVRSLQLDNQGALTTETTSGNGGGVMLQVQDLLLLRRNSNISTTAGTAQAGGNGGDVTIDTDLLVALEDSNITANAFEGRGGNIQIDTQGDFRSPDSEITASSTQGIEGVIEINTPDVDLQSSLTQLSANFVSPEQVVAGSCLTRSNAERGSFTVTGTGGLPHSPYEAVSSHYSVTGVQPIQRSGTVFKGTAVVEAPSWKPGDPVQEAQGMVVTAAGRTIIGTAPQLVAAAKAQDLVCQLK